MTRKLEPNEESQETKGENVTQTSTEKIEPDTEFKTISYKQEDTRGRFAIFFLVGFFIIIVIGLVIGVFSDATQIKNVTDMLLTISGILSGPLGFIIGYYFKRQEESNEK